MKYRLLEINATIQYNSREGSVFVINVLLIFLVLSIDMDHYKLEHFNGSLTKPP